jgi:hydrogenase nickel incorporation protein HypA/HybF
MHELQVTQRILDIVLKHAQANQVTRVISIQLRIGELSDLEDEWIQKYFDYLSKDTIAANARLKIERTPVVLKCNACDHSFSVNIKEIKTFECPQCKSKKCTQISGREYYIKDMEAI